MKTKLLTRIYRKSVEHRSQHKCGGYPYLHTPILTSLVESNLPTQILELGTGLGYSTAGLAIGNSNAHIDTIDQDDSHLDLAQKNWQEIGISHQITSHCGKAEGILPKLSISYDFIFFDGYAPSMKFLIQFERLLRIGGVLITANLYVKDPKGGKYVRALQNSNKWQTIFFDDTAVSVKL